MEKYKHLILSLIWLLSTGIGCILGFVFLEPTGANLFIICSFTVYGILHMAKHFSIWEDETFL